MLILSVLPLSSLPKLFNLAFTEIFLYLKTLKTIFIEIEH